MYIYIFTYVYINVFCQHGSRHLKVCKCILKHTYIYIHIDMRLPSDGGGVVLMLMIMVMMVVVVMKVMIVDTCKHANICIYIYTNI